MDTEIACVCGSQLRKYTSFFFCGGCNKKFKEYSKENPLTGGRIFVFCQIYVWSV